jgi:hypothetical protein
VLLSTFQNNLCGMALADHLWTRRGLCLRRCAAMAAGASKNSGEVLRTGQDLIKNVLCSESFALARVQMVRENRRRTPQSHTIIS